MNAVRRPGDREAEPSGLSMRGMIDADLDAVAALERRLYPHPWTRGIFRDCLKAGYPAFVLADADGSIRAYGLLSVGAGEAHILNVAVADDLQGCGIGRRLTQRLIAIAGSHAARHVFLEVRPSNPVAIALYESLGFNEIGRRPRYYPAKRGREDAIVMGLSLFSAGS